MRDIPGVGLLARAIPEEGGLLVIVKPGGGLLFSVKPGLLERVMQDGGLPGFSELT